MPCRLSVRAYFFRSMTLAPETPSWQAFTNRRQFRDVMRVRGGERAFKGALLMVDVDHFKRVNDHYGHATGDAALAAFGAACRAELRAGDLAARLGGDEFALLLQLWSDRTPEETLAAISRPPSAGASRGAAGGISPPR